MTAVRLRQRVAAPPAEVYRAWLEPELLRRWLAPRGFRVGRVEVDARIGGRLRVWHEHDGADVGGAEAEFVELVPDRRIVARWWFVGPDRETDPAQETQLRVTFEPSGAGATLVTLEHDRLDGLRAAAPEVGDNVEAGWAGTLEVLADALSRP